MPKASIRTTTAPAISGRVVNTAAGIRIDMEFDHAAYLKLLAITRHQRTTTGAWLGAKIRGFIAEQLAAAG